MDVSTANHQEHRLSLDDVMTDEHEFWIDHMVEKHECFHYPYRTETIEIDGQPLVLLVPQWSAKFEVVEAYKAESKVFLILRDLETRGWASVLYLYGLR